MAGPLALACALLGLAPGAHAQEANPAFWLLMPYAARVNRCASLDADIRSRLGGALATARAGSARLLPPAAWDLIGQGLRAPPDEPAAEAGRASCEEFVAVLRDPQFPTCFRQQIAAQFVAPPALTCLVRHPQTAADLPARWSAAFRRQGFVFADEDLAALVRQAALPDSEAAQAATLPLSLADCAEINETLFGKTFDEQYGEEGIRKLFARP